LSFGFFTLTVWPFSSWVFERKTCEAVFCYSRIEKKRRKVEIEIQSIENKRIM